jgi:hypothetical protein
MVPLRVPFLPDLSGVRLSTFIATALFAARVLWRMLRHALAQSWKSWRMWTTSTDTSGSRRTALVALSVIGWLTGLGAQSSEFAFRIESDCPGDVVDTFTQTYLRGVGHEQIAVPFALTPTEQSAIRQTVIDNGFFDLPSTMPVRPPQAVRPGVVGGVVAPQERYIVTIRLAREEHQVRWRNTGPPFTPAEQRLRQVIQVLFDVARTRPEFQSLPPLGGCL